jgi:hypothetical protein
METRDQLIKTIKDWVRIDNEIRTLQSEQSKRKKEKKTISENLIDVMKKNEIDCFELNDGHISYSKTNIKKPITKKVLLNVLSTFFKEDAAKAVELNNYILENREEIIKETIVRRINKGLNQT